VAHQGAPTGRPEVGEALLELLVLGEEGVSLQRLLHRLHQGVALQRLGEEVVGPVLHRVHRRLHRAVGGHQHHLHVGAHGAGGGEQLLPVHPGHHEIGEEHRHLGAAEELQRLRTVRGGEGSHSLVLEDARHRLEVGAVVIDDEDGGGGHQASKCSVGPVERRFLALGRSERGGPFLASSAR